ncbi:15454_t:CDS:2 [Acaulospora colombiana]|uniref:15454_t:CDS:1 n=1 Tax=Acaulospora colombiana TaxID=27376 RepID=A0ACA9LD73_9GLOM|nr:15454_t:CDS:2 [Acaulospora colombiana]
MEPSQNFPPVREHLPIQNYSINSGGEGITKFPSVESYMPSSRTIIGDAPHTQNSLNRMNSHSENLDNLCLPFTPSLSVDHNVQFSREKNSANENQPADDDENDDSEGVSYPEVIKETDPFIDEDTRRTELQKKFFYFFEEPRTFWAKITYRVFINSAYQISLVFVYALLVILVSSAIIWPLERGTLGSDDIYYRVNEQGSLEISPFQSIVHSFWWSISTITTTGYGDIIPVTPFGKLVAGLTMLCGIIVIAMPTSIIGSNLVTEWSLHQRLQFQMRVKKQAQELEGFERNKTKKLKLLKESNESMRQAIVEIQELLADFNPPKYYRKYRDLKSTYLKACGKINELEELVKKYRRINKNLKQFNELTLKNSRRNGDRSDDDEGEDDYGRGMGNVKLWKRSRTDDVHTSEGETKFAWKGLKVSPINTLRKIKKPFSRSLSRENPKPFGRGETKIISKENIGPPMEMRIGYTPIIDERHEHGTPMVRSGSEPLNLNSTSNLRNALLAKNQRENDPTHPASTRAVKEREVEPLGSSIADSDEGRSNKEMLEIVRDDKIEIIVENSPPTEKY